MRKIMALLFLGFCASAQAREFQPIGFESMSMGGAGVASAKGSMAGYYNPALLSRSTYTTEVGLSVGAGVREHKLAENLDQLNQLQFTDAISRVAANAPVAGSNPVDKDRLATSQTILSGMAGGKNGLALMPSAALGIQVKRVGIGIYGTSDATATAVVDPDRLAFILQNGSNYYSYDPVGDMYAVSDATTYANTSLEYAVNNGRTYVKLSGLAVAELPVSYGHPFELGLGKLGVGASLKYMNAMTYNASIKVDTASGDIGDQLDGKEKSSTAMGVDAGLLFTPAAFEKLTVGLVGKNLNSPSFETAVSGESYKVEPQVRAGLDLALFSKLNLAVDMDLTSNKTFITGMDSQYLGGGLNFHPASWFSLRAGAMQNLASSDEGTVLTAGLGFGLKWVQVDVAAQMSTSKGYLDGQEVPRYARANVSLVSRW